MSVGTPVGGGQASGYEHELLQRLWTTKGVRFQASRRLAQLDAASHLAISILSVYVIAGTVIYLLLAPKTAAAYSHILAFIDIVAPVLILVLETHEGGKRYMVRSDRMQRSAQQIQVLHDRLERAVALGSASAQFLDDIDTNYQAILCEYAEHHDDIDYDVLRMTHPHRFPTLPAPTTRRRLRTKLARFASVWGTPMLLILVPGAVITTVISVLLGTK